MSSEYLSPGTYVKETDLTQKVRQISGSGVAVSIIATRGPTDGTLVTDPKRFVELYAEPDPAVGFGHYTVLAHMKKGRKVLVNRILGSNAAHSVAYTAQTILT